jgi:hypothetical protein
MFFKTPGTNQPTDSLFLKFSQNSELGRQWWVVLSDSGIFLKNPNKWWWGSSKISKNYCTTTLARLLYDFYSRWFTDYALDVLKFVPNL